MFQLNVGINDSKRIGRGVRLELELWEGNILEEKSASERKTGFLSKEKNGETLTLIVILHVSET